MENSISYSPSYFVWKQLIGTASWGADRNDTGWPLVAKAFGIMNEKQFWPDNTLLKHGMNACSALHNSRLAADLIALSIERELQQFESAELGMESDDIELYARLPFNDIKRAMDICAKTKDVRSCRDILRSVNTIRHYVLPSNIRSLYYLGLKIFAEAGELKLSDKILSYMIENDLNPR